MDLSKLPPGKVEELLNGPAGVSPTGVYNLTNPANQNDLVVGLAIASLAFTTILVFIRAYNRIIILRRIAIEDYLAFAAYGNFVGLIYVLIHVAYATPGWYVHQWDYRFKDTIPFAFNIHVGSNLITAVILCMKVAILLEWVRIFVPLGTRNAFFWASWVLICTNTMFYLAGIFAENFSCRPYNSIWDKTVPGSQCLDIITLDLASAIIDLISNIAILILPQWVIWGLLKKKLGVAVLFAMGAFGCMCGGFRLAATLEYRDSDDSTYSVSGVAIWALGELVALFLVFCIPVVPKSLNSIGISSAIASLMKSWTGGEGNSDYKGRSPARNTITMSDLPVKRASTSESTEYLKEEAFANDGTPGTMQVFATVHTDEEAARGTGQRVDSSHPGRRSAEGV